MTEIAESVPSYCLVTLGAENHPDRRVLVWLSPMLAGIVQIKVHLTRIRMGELANLEIDHDQASQPPVKEQKVNPVPLGSDSQPLLSGYEGKIIAELQQKM